LKGINKESNKLEMTNYSTDAIGDKHLCPNCNTLVSDLMDLKHYWVKIIREGKEQ